MGAMLRWGCIAAALLCAIPLSAAEVHYATDILPLLQKRCYPCHGPGQQLANLRLDQKDAAMRVIQPGHGADSKLIRMVTGADGKFMPPMGAHLTAAEVSALRSWIDAGAEWPALTQTHWSFRKITRPPVPAVRDAKWPRNPIDNFILARLDSEKIAPSPEAGRATLLRRVTLDLTGLPPTAAEVDDFLRDTRPDAYERAVDRLLASPHYGEKWARYWLDLARYADSDGYEKDRGRPWAWRYREWVIQALNRDMPFDEFTTQQLAGDLMPRRNLDTLVATGFNRNTLTNREGGTDPEQFRDEQVLDRAATLGTVWLGLTVGCAQCHDHKFDPIKQREFYQLTAYFNTQEEANVLAPMPGELGPYLAAKPAYDRKRAELLVEYKIPEAQAKYEERLRNAALHPGQLQDADFAYGEFTHTVDNARKVLFMDPDKRSEVQQNAMTDVFIGSCGNAYPKDYCASLKLGELRGKLNQLNVTLPPVSYAPVLIENDTPPKTYIHIKGDWREHGPEVQPGMLAVLPALPAGAHTRLQLAQWLTSPENPLTSRVAVNRIWQELMGRGIVATSEDFGTQGDRPTHPELLDWLASEYMARGWSSKQMVRLIVTSATYRQSSHARPELEAKDPANTLLSHMSRLRLPAELVRDQALSAAGLIDLRVGGRSVKPPQPKGVAELSYAGSVKWEESSGPDRYRRGLYIHFQRTTPYPQLMNFDAPSANLSCTRRERTDTPLQALNLMNDPVFFEAAQALAFRIVREATGPFRDRLDYAFRITLGRAPNAREAERMGKYYDDALRTFEQAPQNVAALFPNHLEGVPQKDAAAWVELSRVLLNLDEFITRE
jgi:hypothetical protein